MTKMICLVICIALAMPTLACAGDIAQPKDPFQGMYGCADGHVLAGTPNLTIAGDTLYMDAYAYMPKRPCTSVIPDTTGPMTAEKMAILTNAHAAAARSPNWKTAFMASINSHGNAASAREENGMVIVTIDGVGDIPILTGCESNPAMKNRTLDGILDAERLRFFENYYNRGVWVFWGCDYDILIPPQRQPETLEAMKTLLAGGTLTSHQVNNTPFMDPGFVRDFNAARGR